MGAISPQISTEQDFFAERIAAGVGFGLIGFDHRPVGVEKPVLIVAHESQRPRISVPRGSSTMVGLGAGFQSGADNRATTTPPNSK